MKVCHLASGDLWAGAEVQLATLISGLTKFDDLQLTVILLNSGLLAERIAALNIPVRVLEERAHNSMRLLVKIRRALCEERFDILHTHRFKENIIGGLAGSVSNVPHHIRTVHGMPEPSTGLRNLKSRVYNALDALITRARISKSIAVSHDIERSLSARFGADRVVMIHNGIDLSGGGPTTPASAVRQRMGFDTSHQLIGSVGRLTPVKGYQFLLGAFRRVAERNPKARLVLVGDGPERQNLESLSREYGLDEKVCFHGFTSEVAEVLGALDLFVLSSLHEGISISLLESLASGVPVVVTDVGGNPEVVQDSISGLLVPPCDERALADAIVSVLGDPVRSGSFAKAGRQVVETEFSRETMATRVHDLYRGIVDESKG